MDNTIYATLNRQSGLMGEMRAIANNIANSSTTGFRREGVIFAEYVRALGDGDPSLSMATADGRIIDLAQGPMQQTGGTFDFAIEGEGFFLVETPTGNQLTRSGAFARSAEGELVTLDGHRLLDAGGAPVFVPPDSDSISVARDGTLSADGTPLGRIGLWNATSPDQLIHLPDNRFSVSDAPISQEGSHLLQGFLESSNVNAVEEIARMIEVQRSYELGQAFLDREDERIRAVIRTFSR